MSVKVTKDVVFAEMSVLDYPGLSQIIVIRQSLVDDMHERIGLPYKEVAVILSAAMLYAQNIDGNTDAKYIAELATRLHQQNTILALERASELIESLNNEWEVPVFAVVWISALEKEPDDLKSEAQTKAKGPLSIEVEATSIEEARMKIKTKVPEGFEVLKEIIKEDGSPRTASFAADTMNAAIAKGREKISSDATIIEIKELHKQDELIGIVDAYDEQNAQRIAREFSAKREPKSGPGICRRVRLLSAGKKGFIGTQFGAKPGRYEVELLLQAVTQIIYKPNVKIKAIVNELDYGDSIRLFISRGGIVTGISEPSVKAEAYLYCQNCGKKEGRIYKIGDTFNFCTGHCKSEFSRKLLKGFTTSDFSHVDGQLMESIKKHSSMFASYVTTLAYCRVCGGVVQATDRTCGYCHERLR